MSKKSSFILLLFFVISSSIHASYPYVRNYSKSTTTGGSQNWSIVQADNDWMYFANNRGLLEYDGSKWTLYQNKSNSLIRSLYFDKPSSRLYAGSYNEFGYFERDSKGLLRYKLISNSSKLNVFSDIWNIHKLKNKFIFQTESEIIMLDNKKLFIHKLKDKIYQSAVIGGQLIIAQLYKGISYYDGKGFVEFANNAVLKNKVVRAILPYQGNKVLFVTDNDGIFSYDGKDFSVFKTSIDIQLKDNQVFCAAIKNNVLAIGTVRNGLITLDLSDESTSFTNTSTGLQNNTVLSVTFDNQDNLWLGLDNGIDYCMVSAALTDLIGNSNAVGAGYSSCLFNNKLYLATNQGLYYMNYDSKEQKAAATAIPVSQIKGQVWSVFVFDNALFCSCDKGLFIIDNKGIQKVPQLSGVWCLKPLNNVPNALIGAEYDRFFILKKIAGKWIKANQIQGIEESDRNFVIGSDGKIWITIASNGVYRLTLNSALTAFTEIELVNFIYPLSSYQRIVLSQNNNQIIASTVNGFFVFDDKMRKFKPDISLNTLFHQPLYASNLQFQPDAKIWSLANNKIAVVTKLNTGKYNIDSISFNSLAGKLVDGFEHMNVISPHNIIFATENGFTVYNPSRYKLKVKTSKIAFKAVTLTQPADSIISGFLSVQSETDHPQLSHKNNSIRFDFICPEFRNTNSVLYSYKLNGFDEGWSSFSTFNAKEYSNLPPGSYTFKVRAKNLINLDVVTTGYSFRVLPPWYQTVTAYIVYLLLLGVAVYLLVLFIEYKADKAAKKMEMLKEQENKEQEKLYQIEVQKQEKEIIALKNKHLEFDLRHKSQDLASSTMNLIRKNEILLEMNNHLSAINEQLKQKIEPQHISKEILSIQKDITANIESDNHWEKFQANFDLIYDNFLTRLGDVYPNLTHNDKRICAYLRMNLTSKDIAPLVNTTYQSVEMTRHRLRKKLELDRAVNLTDFLQHF